MRTIVREVEYRHLEESIINLWRANQPAQFWQIAEEVDQGAWKDAVQKAINLNQKSLNADDIDHVLYNTLGEGRFGKSHWELSLFNRFYWLIKPVIPFWMIQMVRSIVHKVEREMSVAIWPIDHRNTHFQWEIMRQYLLITGREDVTFKNFWPDQNRFSLVLTHDIETPKGLSFVPKVAALEEKFGFRSSFNIVGDQIPKDRQLFKDLSERGFEIGLHGWHHDGSAYQSREKFLKTVKIINEKLIALGAVGFRSPLNLRNPEWMQELEIEYDLSFFDTDPFEPISGGVMSIWPFKIGHFIELPATLVQDNTLVNLLGEKSPRLWLEKVDYIEKYFGMALVNCHPDYLVVDKVWRIYEQFLSAMSEKQGCWNALPRETARWWRKRTESQSSGISTYSNTRLARLVKDKLVIH